MTNNIKKSFDGIHAEDKLKSNTTKYLQEEIKKRTKSSRDYPFKGYVATFASIIILFISGIFPYKLYFTPVTFVDVDINPSIELILNRFDRIIGTHAYNEDGNTIIAGISLTHKNYDDALIILVENITKQGYLQNEILVSITLQTNDKSREANLLNSIQAGIENYMLGHHHTAQVDVFSVSSDTRNHSHKHGISPAKYLAIQELMGVDPTVSMESCQNHSIREIKQLLREHGNHHGNDFDSTVESDNTFEAPPASKHPRKNNSRGYHRNRH